MIPLPKLLDSNLHESMRIRVEDVSINDKLIPLSYATMKLTKNVDIPAKSFVELFNPNGSAGVYRTKTRPKAYGRAFPTVELEHAITELGDYLVRDDIEEEMTVRNAMVRLMGHYRGNKWQLGSFTATETVLVDTKYEPVLQVILSVLEQQPKYYLDFDFTTSPWTVTLKKRDTTVSAEGRLSRNVESAIVTPDESEMCTRVYMEGLPKQSGQLIGYVEADAATIQNYGVIERTIDGDDNLTAQQAQRKANSYLNNHKKPKLGISISGADFSTITGEKLDRVKCGKLYRLAVPEYNTTIEETITGIGWASVYKDPLKVTIDLAEQEDPIVSYLTKQANKARSGGRSGGRATKELQDFWQATVQAIGQDGQINAASIGLAINAEGSQAWINADHITMGSGEDAETVINGKASLSDVTASYIQSQVAMLETLEVQAMSCSGTISANSVNANNYYVGDEFELQPTNIRDASVSGNTLTLYRYEGEDINFSKAIASWEQSWGSNGRWTAKALPQNQSVWVRIYQGVPSLANKTLTVPIMSFNSEEQSTISDVYHCEVDLSDYLTTGSYSTNGTKTPGSGKLGFSSVSINITPGNFRVGSSSGTSKGTYSASSLIGKYLLFDCGGTTYNLFFT